MRKRTTMTAIPRYRLQSGPAILSAGFRPFFLAAAGWAALAVPLWLALFGGEAAIPSALPPAVWHAHEMVFGYSAAVVAGFLLTAIPNWTGRMPLQLGNRLGVATLLMLISFVGGRIVPSFTRNWLAKQRPEVSPPAPFDIFDRIMLATTAPALALWVAAPEAAAAHWLELAAGLALAMRLARWRGQATLREPLLLVLHVGYGWLALGFLLLALDALIPLLPETTALHALTAGAIGTMTLAVMTRASLGHTGRSLIAGPGTTAIYVLITVAALFASCGAARRSRLSANAMRCRDGMERRVRLVRGALCAAAVAASCQRRERKVDLSDRSAPAVQLPARRNAIFLNPNQ
jgi:uncharacterized protein involved in response to NO